MDKVAEKYNLQFFHETLDGKKNPKPFFEQSIFNNKFIHIKSRRKILKLKETEEAILKKEKATATKKLNKEVQKANDIGSDEEEAEEVNPDEEEIENIIEKDKDRGFKKGNNPKLEREFKVEEKKEKAWIERER
jgi:hypothetical protein